MESREKIISHIRHGQIKRPYLECLGIQANLFHLLWQAASGDLTLADGANHLFTCIKGSHDRVTASKYIANSSSIKHHVIELSWGGCSASPQLHCFLAAASQPPCFQFDYGTPPLAVVWKAWNFKEPAEVPLLNCQHQFLRPRGASSFCESQVVSFLRCIRATCTASVQWTCRCSTSRTAWLCDFQPAIILRCQAAHAHLHHNLLGTAKNWTIWGRLPPAHRASDELPEATTSHGNASVMLCSGWNPDWKMRLNFSTLLQNPAIRQ